jgi:hypothetical protein
MAKKLTSVTIVGGGTAGWMSAVFLATHLNRRADVPIRITLIESPNVPTVGVGEATVPAMPHWLQRMGISETEFIARCNATFKLGVRFTNWNVKPDGSPRAYVHPFDGVADLIWGVNPAYHYCRFAGPADPADYVGVYSPADALIDARRGPKRPEQEDFESVTNYAYHLDAGLFAGLLKEIALARGVTHVLDDVVEVERRDDGFIDRLLLKEKGEHPVELVIDCTGFRSVILQETLGVPFESYEKSLFNDRALALQIPHPDPAVLEPCTRSTALSAGWVWRVPLHSRVGTGYVFSSRFKDDDAAADEFLAHLGDVPEGASPRVIGMKVGRAARSWEKNCIAIGLSGGFVEPLESTAIYLIESGLRWLGAYFPDADFAPSLARRYNALMDRLYREIRDFIVLHYITSNRTDTPYWVASQHDIEVPDSLAEAIEVMRHALPDSDDFEQGLLFNHYSYLLVLAGKGLLDGLDLPLSDRIAEEDWKQFARHMRRVRADMLRALPDHRKLVDAIRSRATGPAGEGAPKEEAHVL